jgi:hypothetical protein
MIYKGTVCKFGPKNDGRKVILIINNHFPNPMVIQMISPYPRRQKAQIKIPVVLNAKIPIFFFSEI